MPITELQGLLYARTEKGASLGLNPIISTTSCRGFKNTQNKYPRKFGEVAGVFRIGLIGLVIE